MIELQLQENIIVNTNKSWGRHNWKRYELYGDWYRLVKVHGYIYDIQTTRGWKET